MAVKIEIERDEQRIEMEYSWEGCERKLEFKYYEGGKVKLEAVGRADCAGFEAKAHGVPIAVMKALDLMVKELGFENLVKVLNSMAGPDLFGFTQPTYIQPVKIEFAGPVEEPKVDWDDSSDNAPGDGGAEEG